MKAAIQTRYDKNNFKVEIKEIPKPDVDKNEVLIKVMTAGVNPLDLMILHGDVKAIVGYKMPLITGNELAGEIVEIGSDVRGFAKADKVFARLPLSKIGAFAEYVAVDYKALAKIPDYLNWEEAAAVPLTALTGMQSLELLGAKSGESIFISGGSGSLGAMLIPIAHAQGLIISTSGGAESKERLLSIGVSQFFDYKTQDYTKELKDIDYVIDTLGDRELLREYSILKKGGKLASLRAMPDGDFAKREGLGKFKEMLFSIVGRKYNKQAKQFGTTYDFLFVHSDGEQLDKAAQILADRQVRPSVDAIFSLDEVNAALDKVAHGKSNGKTVLKMY